MTRRPVTDAAAPPPGGASAADLKQLTRARNPDLVVLSYDEITADTCVEIVRRASDLVPVAA